MKNDETNPTLLDNQEFKEFVSERLIDDDINYIGNALAGEVGEVNNVLKRMHVKTKSKQYQDILNKQVSAGIINPLDVQLKEELGDVMFYIFALIDKFGFSLSDILEMQKHKIIGQSIAYQEKFKK